MYTYLPIHSFLYSFPTEVTTEHWVEFLLLYSRSLLVIYFIYSSVYIQRRQWHPTPVLLPGKSHGRKSLEGCSPWGRWSWTRPSDFTFTFHFSCIGEGNGNPLQCFAWRIPGTGEPGGLLSMGSHRVGHDWSDLAAAAVTPINIWKSRWGYKTVIKSHKYNFDQLHLIKCNFFLKKINVLPSPLWGIKCPESDSV